MNFIVKIVINDYPAVVCEAQRALFNIILNYSHSVDLQEHNSWSVMLKTLENQFDCLVRCAFVTGIFVLIFIF
jgi:hypothetical protein